MLILRNTVTGFMVLLGKPKMSNKKSFILHIDSLNVLDDLTDEQCGELLRAFKAYHSSEQLDLSPIVKIAFSPFKNQFQRDLEKYEKICERNRINGLQGGRPESKKNPKEPTGLSGNPNKPKKADNDSDSKNDSDNDKDSDSKKDNDNKNTMSSKLDVSAEILNYLNEKTNKKFKPVDSNLKLINARLKEGHQVEDLKWVVDKKTDDWLKDEKMNQYLRPATLFNAEKFNSYIGEKGFEKPLTEKERFHAMLDDDVIEGECNVIN